MKLTEKELFIIKNQLTQEKQLIDIYKTNLKTGRLDKIDTPIKGCWINIVKPTDSEIEKIVKEVGVKERVLRYPLDIAEKAHIDVEDDSVLIVVDSPATEKKHNTKIYTTLPVIILVSFSNPFFVYNSKSPHIILLTINTPIKQNIVICLLDANINKHKPPIINKSLSLILGSQLSLAFANEMSGLRCVGSSAGRFW